MLSAEEKAYELLGTCNSFSPCEYFEDDESKLREFDDIVLLCLCCSWWVESHDVDEEGNCSDCSEKEED